MATRDPASEPLEPPALWTATDRGAAYPALDHDLETDVAIVGGGIVGLTAARLLSEAGLDVTVLEARRVGRQVTGRSTAKVTSQHALKYHDLRTAYGAEAARLYADANQEAVRAIEHWSPDLDAHFEPRTAYVYTTDRDKVSALQQEVDAATEAGLPARFTSDVPLPEAVGAVAFDEQGQFDPYAYTAGLARRVVEGGGHVFEDTRIERVEEGEPCVVGTDHSTSAQHTVTARKVILATHLPIMDRGLYFARTKPRAHAVIAALLDGPPLDGMFISADSPTRSLRSFEDERGAWLVFLGASYTPGAGTDTAATFEEMEAEVRERFPIRSVEYRWTNEDYDSVDGLPMVGPLLPTRKHISIATGFSAWGITNGHVAGQILADAILEQPRSGIAELFDPRRLHLKEAAGKTVEEVIESAKGLASRYAPGRLLEVATVRPGDAAVGEVNGERAAVSRDEDGTLHVVSAICTHMGCLLGWNSAMRTWDCRCHGSSFSRDGAVLHGPAVAPLERIEVDER